MVVGIFELIERASLPTATLLKNIAVPRHQLFNPRNRVDWDVFATFVDNWVEVCASDEEVLRTSREYGRVSALGYVRRVAQLVASPTALQSCFDRWIGPANVSNMKVLQRGVGADEIYEVELSMPEPFKPSRGFLLGTVSVYEELPTMLGLPRARVESQVGPRHARYRVTFPPSGTLWARMTRNLAAFRGMGGFVEMLRRQHDEVTASLALATRQKQDFERLLGTISDGVVLLHEGRVHFANRALIATLRAADTSSLRTQEFSEWVAVDDRALWRQQLLAPAGSPPRDVRFLANDGSAVLCETAPQGTVLFADTEAQLVVLRDVTEHRALDRALADTARRERTTVAHELHDGAGQLLAGAALKATVLETRLARAASTETALAAEVAALVKTCGQQLREMAHTLTPVLLESRGFVPALHQLAATTTRLFEVECSVELAAAGTPELSAETGAEIFRIVQESLNNAIRTVAPAACV